MKENNTVERDPELSDSATFLRQSPPFDELSDSELEQIVASLSLSYHCAGESFDRHSLPAGLRILRSGAVDIRDAEGALLDRLGEGESFHIGGLNAEPGEVRANIIEDSLFYLLPDAAYRSMRIASRKVDRYFSGQRRRRLRRAARYTPQPHSMMRELATVMSTDLLTVRPADTVQQVASIMAQRRCSCALVTQNEVLLGIITDRDLRERVVAAALSLTTAVSDVMTADPDTVESSATLFDAMLFMTQRNYHHLPVVQQGKLRGIVTTSDLMLARQDDPIYLVQHISRKHSVAELSALAEGIPSLMVQWVEAGMAAQQVSRLLTAVSDAITRRLIQLAEQQLGAAPVSWCWLGFGSQARAEQLLGADQDNGIIISDEVSQMDMAWFESLARIVCDGLQACGYDYCPGDVMASNTLWRQPLAAWIDNVDSWVRSPTPQAVMRVSIFFDLRAIYGDAGLCTTLQERMLSRASSNTIFQATLAANALEASPPLGIFRRFVVDRNGDHGESLDLKKRGLLLVTDAVRLRALAHGIAAVSTEERLRALVAGKHMALGDARDLGDALVVMQQLRVEHQARQVAAEAVADNFLNPRHLPRLAREQLRDAFTIVSDSQAALKQSFRQGIN